MQSRFDEWRLSYRLWYTCYNNYNKQEVKVIWQKAPHGGPIPRLGVTPGGRNLQMRHFNLRVHRNTFIDRTLPESAGK